LLYYIAPTLLLIVCVVHAVRTGRIFPWIYVIIFLPGIGSLIYLGVEVIPDLLRSRRARQFGSAARDIADPNRGFRQAHRDVALVGSVDAKKNLAEEYVSRGQYADAIAMYRDALQGQFKDDNALLLGLAKAQFLSGDGTGAQASLDTLQAADPKFSSADAHLLYARALELQGKDQDALAEYQKLVRYYPGEEARTRMGLLLLKLGRREEARALFEEVVRLLTGAPSRYVRQQKQWGDIARQNLKA
jgi:hypothetical protein